MSKVTEDSFFCRDVVRICFTVIHQIASCLILQQKQQTQKRALSKKKDPHIKRLPITKQQNILDGLPWWSHEHDRHTRYINTTYYLLYSNRVLHKWSYRTEREERGNIPRKQHVIIKSQNFKNRMNELRIIYFRYGNNFNLQRTTSWVYYHTYTHTYMLTYIFLFLLIVFSS